MENNQRTHTNPDDDLYFAEKIYWDEEDELEAETKDKKNSKMNKPQNATPYQYRYQYKCTCKPDSIVLGEDMIVDVPEKEYQDLFVIDGNSPIFMNMNPEEAELEADEYGTKKAELEEEKELRTILDRERNATLEEAALSVDRQAKFAFHNMLNAPTTEIRTQWSFIMTYMASEAEVIRNMKTSLSY